MSGFVAVAADLDPAGKRLQPTFPRFGMPAVFPLLHLSIVMSARFYGADGSSAAFGFTELAGCIAGPLLQVQARTKLQGQSRISIPDGRKGNAPKSIDAKPAFRCSQKYLFLTDGRTIAGRRWRSEAGWQGAAGAVRTGVCRTVEAGALRHCAKGAKENAPANARKRR